MALIFIDGFDHINQYQLDDKGWEVASESFITISTAYSRWADGSYGMQISNNLGWIRYYFKDRPSNTIYVGFAVKKDRAVTPLPSVSEPLIALHDEVGAKQISVVVNADYSIGVYNGDGTLIGTTAINTFMDDKWFYFEIKIKIGQSDGEVELRVNEQTVLNLTGQDTKNGTDYIAGVYLNCIRNDVDTLFDDFYIDNAQFHGNVKVRTFMPDSDETYSQWARSGGSNDFECVDEKPANTSDYIKSSTKGQKSTFGITTGALGNIKGIQLGHYHAAVTGGLRRIKPLIRSGGADYEGPVSAVIASIGNWKMTKHIRETDPQDGQPWNQTKLEAAEFGLRLVDGTTTTSTTSTTTTT